MPFLDLTRLSPKLEAMMLLDDYLTAINSHCVDVSTLVRNQVGQPMTNYALNAVNTRIIELENAFRQQYDFSPPAIRIEPRSYIEGSVDLVVFPDRYKP